MPEKPPKIVESVDPKPAEQWRKQKDAESRNRRDPEREATYDIRSNDEVRKDPILHDLAASMEHTSAEEDKVQIAAFIKAYPEKAKAYEPLFREIEDAVGADRAKRAAIVERIHAQIEQESTNDSPHEGISADDILRQDLAYQDVPGFNDEKRGVLESTVSNESAQKYAEALRVAATNGSSIESVRATADALKNEMIADAARLGIELSPAGHSRSWAMWDIGKQYYFFTHPDENNSDYTIGDPFTSSEKKTEIINRHLGWEAYGSYHANADYADLVRTDKRFEATRALFEMSPKENGTLSSKHLAELGGLLRAIPGRVEVPIQPSREDMAKAEAFRRNLEQHAEAMHIKAQEAAGIKNPESLKNPTENPSQETRPAPKQSSNAAPTPNDFQKAWSWFKKRGVMEKAAISVGGSAAVGLGAWGLGTAAASLGAATSASALGLSPAVWGAISGVGAGLLTFGAFALLEIGVMQVLWGESKKLMGGLGGGGGGQRRARPAGGGGGGHGGGH